MKDSIKHKLDRLAERHAEVSALLSDADTINDNNKFRELSMEYAKLEPVVTRYADFGQLLKERVSALDMAEGSDFDMRDLGRDEVKALDVRIAHEEDELSKLLVPKD